MPGQQTTTQTLENHRKEAVKAVAETKRLADLEAVRVEYLGKKGKVTAILRELGTLPEDERRRVGQLANRVREELEDSIARRRAEVTKLEVEEKLRAETIDVTLPGKQPRRGHAHLISKTIAEIASIFIGLGYRVAEGPEVDLDYYNFEALNTPADHPARSVQDTFYILKHGDQPQPNDIVLRTHTSPVQIRVMEKQKPPLFIIAPGKAFRRDVADPSHVPMFHQVEGFAVDERITLGDLSGTLETFARQMFGENRRVRLRPHFFPFTEPSAEVDVSCFICEGVGCRLCGNGWLEILGAGMIDPNVLKEVGYDPEKVTGFAFGMGVERIAILKHGLDDIRLLFENDVRFLKQF